MRIITSLRSVAILALAVLGGCVVVDEGPINPGPQYCTQEYAPVCARRGDDRRTFPNDCYAEREGYSIIRDGECRGERPDYPGNRPPRPPQPDRPQACPMIYAPVCAQRGGDRRTFENACQASAAGYGVLREGECRGGGQGQRPPGSSGDTVEGGPRPPRPPVTNRPNPGGACTREYAPVCGIVNGNRQTFGNECTARAAGAQRVRPGPC